MARDKVAQMVLLPRFHRLPYRGLNHLEKAHLSSEACPKLWTLPVSVVWCNSSAIKSTNSKYNDKKYKHFLRKWKLFWTNGTAVVCRHVGLTVAQQSSSTTTTDQCSPRWIVHQNQRRNQSAIYRVAINPRATTQQQCLSWCEKLGLCKAVEWGWGLHGCLAHKTDEYRDREPHSGITQFELIRGCETSGIVMSIQAVRSKRVNYFLSY